MRKVEHCVQIRRLLVKYDWKEQLKIHTTITLLGWTNTWSMSWFRKYNICIYLTNCSSEQNAKCKLWTQTVMIITFEIILQSLALLRTNFHLWEEALITGTFLSILNNLLREAKSFWHQPQSSITDPRLQLSWYRKVNFSSDIKAVKVTEKQIY